jgi:hypothetical protein
MWAMWGWLLAMCSQVALLGRQLHCVALLADLETDLVNPHDWARQMMRFRVRERERERGGESRGKEERTGAGGGAARRRRERERGTVLRAVSSQPCNQTHKTKHKTQHKTPTTNNDKQRQTTTTNDDKKTRPQPKNKKQKTKNKKQKTKNKKQKTAEYVGQSALAALLLLSGAWFSGGANLLLAAFVLLKLLVAREDRCDPGDAFACGPGERGERAVAAHRRNRLFLLSAHAVLFALLTFRLVESAAREAMRHHPGGPADAKLLARELLRAAAASTHGY